MGWTYITHTSRSPPCVPYFSFALCIITCAAAARLGLLRKQVLRRSAIVPNALSKYPLPCSKVKRVVQREREREREGEGEKFVSGESGGQFDMES
jgi:uncharacterized oligopeptide transporter (OPT) family protein